MGRPTPLRWTYAGTHTDKHGEQRVHAGDDVYFDFGTTGTRLGTITRQSIGWKLLARC